MKIDVDSSLLKSPAGIVAGLLIALAAFGFLRWRSGQLQEQGAAQVEEYLRLELPARYSREMLDQGRGQEIDPGRLEALSQVEVVELSPGWLFRADRDGRVRVRTVVRIGTGDQATLYFQFRSTTGGWRLANETAPPLLDQLF